MRLLAVPLCLFAAGFLRVCDSDEKGGAGAAASARADGSASVAGVAGVKAALAAARIGGSVASAGDYSVEVGLHESGLVDALVSDVRGLLVTDGVELGILARLKGGASEKIQLAFVPARARFEGRAKAGSKLAPGPVDVSLHAGGKAHGCQLAAAVVAPEPKLGGNVLVAGGYSAELFAKPSGEVLAFVKDSASVDVRGDAGASFKAIATAKGGAREEIALSFDAPRACFAGKAKAGVELAPGPLELVVDAKAGAGIGRLESVALSVDASHGGQVAAVGDFSVELVAQGAEVSAFVFDAAGKAHSAGDLELKLDVGAGAGSALALKWDAPSLSYKAAAQANVDLAMQPIRISLIAAGKAFSGAFASLKAAAKLDANAKLDTSAKLDADAKLAAGANAKLDPKLDAKAKANVSKGASASLKVTPPKVNVSAKQSAGAKAGAGAGAGAGAKASAGFSFGSK